MKKLITTLLGLAVLSPFALAGDFTITLLPGTVFESDGTGLLHSDDVNVFYAVGTQDAAGYASDFGTSTTVTADAFNDLGTLSWVSLSELTASGQDYWTSPGWTGFSGSTVNTSTVDATILVALTDAASVAAAADTNTIGLMATNSVVPGLGSINFTLGGSTALGFTTLAGSGSGSITLLAGTPVPEPSAYALIGGLFALGCVMLRRRA